MKRIFPYCLILTTAFVTTVFTRAQEPIEFDEVQAEELTDSVQTPEIEIIDPAVLFDSMPQPEVNYKVVNMSFIPKVFSGYKRIDTPKINNKTLKYNLMVMTPIEEELLLDEDGGEGILVMGEETVPVAEVTPDEVVEEDNGMPSIRKYATPDWLRGALNAMHDQYVLMYSYMIDNPESIEYAYWDLPERPVLILTDPSFVAFLNRQEVPEVSPEEAVIKEEKVRQIHWLHTVKAGLQFSQAYVSPNWYQGGNNYLSLLFNFNWNVQLNQVYHPKILFQSDLSYKMALSSNPKGYLHKYTIAEDNFQYNLNTGLKAAKDWYYSLNLQFKTQLLNNYAETSNTRTAAFLSPGDLNIGLGMSYNHKNKLNTFSYTLTVSPLSYNLKTCISDKVDHATYNIPVDKRAKSEVGSNLELTLDWKITPNISYKTRVFMFTDYKYYLADWQNTFNFEINKFLSTQLFIHLRYDGSTESDTKWKKFMMREILSFGLSYTFSTKP